MFSVNVALRKENREWGGYDFSKPSLAIISFSQLKKQGLLLHGVGGHIMFEVFEMGYIFSDDLGLIPPTSSGIWVWEGKYMFQPEYEDPKNGFMEPVGKWRRPTEEEFLKIRDGICPWNDDDWKLQNARQAAPNYSSSTLF